jgi:hypothetical protein
LTVIREDVYRCEECGVEVRVPSNMPAQVRAEFARLVRESPQVRAALLFRRYSRRSFTECKIALRHVSAPGENCHHCWADLPGKGAVVCTECRALNLNW